MKSIVRSFALMAMVLGFVSLSAQERRMSAENPDIMRYTKALELTEEQQTELKAIYSETEDKMKSNKDEMVALRKERMAKDKEVSQDEKDAWRAKMDETSKERRLMVDERNKKMMDILTEEQLVKYKEYKEQNPSPAKAAPSKK